MNKHYDKLIRTLRRLFEMDRADLDFGFYRIMHAKAEQVQEFIEKDLLQTVKDAFGEQSSKNTQELLEQARQKVIQTLGEDALDADGNLKPAFSSIPAGKQYQDDVAQILRQKDDASAETDVYDHLCRFFERYYEGGDFVSRRYYARETSGKAAPYAIPYNGEEVKLHWANADQYYIKTTEKYNNFTFDLRQAREVQAALQNTPLLAAQDKTDKTPLRVHFRIKEAAEGEHGNVKATDAGKRFFVLHPEQPVEKNEAGELVVNFEYKPLPGGKYAIDAETEKQLKGLYGSLNKGDMPAFDMATKILDAVESMEGVGEYRRLLQVLSPTEKIKKRPLIVRYLNKYTASNTMDYFIHKDLGGFLRRELDFYIKNEVMHLDDIENADAPAVESYLAMIKVLRRIAGKLIDFLAQLEDFQKKLWLKKKFVVENNYCLTLDRVPEELRGEIVGCEAQWLEWVGLGFLTTEDTERTEQRIEILGKEPFLVLDTKFYGEGFKERLLASFDNLDEQCDGLLIHSENFQALNLLQKRYREQVKCIHIDPPYNTATSGFLYKNEYQHSSWLAMMANRINLSLSLLSKNAAYLCHIDENEYENLHSLFESYLIPNAGTIVWDKRNPMNGV
jgi:adenine-specific DNA-methyltransferase